MRFLWRPQLGWARWEFERLFGRFWKPGAGGAGCRGGLFAGWNRSFTGVVIEAAKNHFTRGLLVPASYKNAHSFVDEAASAVHHDHGAVLEIGDALIDFLAFAKDEN